ncbi:unnamed protein product [Rhizophagus irregularis]|uniref:SHSP domain-containing protein n=1 Tax=Rhizophagus irregularis TaxID=588596 RepID=A0A916E6M8_9GLOM|nr:unnamed protein product [Rhizophagus irregularis]CAB5358862.1 unnamed protein product [Rhizophagus irregularis]
MNFDDSFRRMRRTFDDFFNDPCYRKPAIDVYNKSDEYVLHADVPGIQKSDVNVELVGDNNLVIEGEFKPYKGFDRNKLLVNERDCGKFRREIFLSCDLQVDKMSAVIENGILEVRLPKAQRTSSTAWERWCRNSANGISLDARPTVIAFVRKLKLVITIEEFNQLEQDFIKWILTNNLTKLLSYYKKEWQSCQQLWANIYKPKFVTGWMVNETNNLIERFFSTLKWKFLHGKKNKRIDMLINILINQCSDFFTIRFYTQINQQIFNEKKFNEIKSRELKAREIAENNTNWKDLKIIIQRIQNIPNTDNGIEIKKQAEFQMKEFFRSPTNVLGKNKLNVKRRKDDNDIIENALKESTQI